MSEKPLTIDDIVAKRKKRWAEKHDIDYDKRLVDAAAVEILSQPDIVSAVLERPWLLIEAVFTIVDKDRKSVPFFLNDVQQDFIKQLDEHGTSKPYFVLKGRQQGFTTLISAIQLSFAIVRKNFSGFTMADRADNTAVIFNEKAKSVYERLPDLLKPTERYNNAYELSFSKLNSAWRIATATDDVGRSRTLNFVHFSEVAFYSCSLGTLQAGIGEAIAQGAYVIYETTANGYNEAKALWDGQSCVNLFYQWWRTAEYTSTEYEYIDKADKWLSERIEILKGYGLTREQICWYAKKYFGYLDKNLIRQEYPCTPEEAFISTGASMFDIEGINSQLARAHTRRDKVGKFTYTINKTPICDDSGNAVDFDYSIDNIKFVETSQGFITIHSEPETKTDGDGNIIQRKPYTLGGDTAGSGNDYFTGKVIDNITAQTVATLRVQRIDEDEYTEQMICLGRYFNDALIGIEVNYSRYPQRVLQKYGYTRIYFREKMDKLADEPMLVPGFETTSKTKPIIIQNLVALFRDDPTIEPDIETLKEMLVFCKRENGKMEALDGYHDDLVMADAIAHHIGGQQSRQWETVEMPESNFLTEHFHINTETESGTLADIWEDL